MRVQGFIVTFIDQCGQPVVFDDYNSFMKVEGIYSYPQCGGYMNYFYNELIPNNNKIFYTYTVQGYNDIPLNTAFWACYLNADVPLQLTFNLTPKCEGPIRMVINMFYLQDQFECKLGPVIDKCICNDFGPCVCCPYQMGYVSWMTTLREPCPPPPCPPPCPPCPPPPCQPCYYQYPQYPY